MKYVFLAFLLVGCSGTKWIAPNDFTYKPIRTNEYTIASWQKISDSKLDAIHIYVEGDGYSFDAYGQPTSNPTPKSKFMRNLATMDKFPNVAYVARPCQFIMDEKCSESDWTSGRFSQKILDSVQNAMEQIAGNKKITIIGYSGGAMISGILINQNKNLRFEKWITIAGVLNHKKWTEYFGDAPLNESVDMEKLPNIEQIHYVGENDKIVPYELAKTWAPESDIMVIPNARHDKFDKMKIFD